VQRRVRDHEDNQDCSAMVTSKEQKGMSANLSEDAKLYSGVSE
jgi:hypothetical protein